MTMMSMFSSFDALCFEKLHLSEKDQLGKGSTKSSSGNGGSGFEGKNKATSSAAEERWRRRPRFGVEIDGVHCFETILPS